MKRRTLFAVASLLLLGACTKEDAHDIINNAVYPVNFTLSSLTTEVVPITRSGEGTTQLSDYFTQLHYFGYASNVKVFAGEQTYSSENASSFGKVTAQVPAETYYIGFFGVGSGVGSAWLSIGDVAGDNDYIENTGREIWCKEFKSLAVNSTTNNIDVVMTRKTGRLTLNITDKAPDNVGRVNILVYYSKRYRISKGSSVVSTSGQYTADIPITNGVLAPFEFNCFESGGGITVVITIFDKNNEQLDSRDISLNVYENRKTIITGELFNNVNGKEFTITVSDDWGEDNIVDL